VFKDVDLLTRRAMNYSLFEQVHDLMGERVLWDHPAAILQLYRESTGDKIDLERENKILSAEGDWFNGGAKIITKSLKQSSEGVIDER
jgi:hypothetical protein